MKKFFKLSLIFFTFALITSCTQFINAFGTESVEFNFRAAAELDGSELIVKVVAKGNEKTQSKVINVEQSKVIKFDFGEYPVGTKISVTATVKNKSGEEIYKGTTTTKIITGKNNIVLGLKPNVVNLVVDLPRPNTSIDGAKLKVFVGGVEKISDVIQKADNTKKLTVPVNATSSVSVVIENTDSTERYFESDDYFFTDADLGKDIKIKLKPYGMFMWSFNVGENPGQNSVDFDVVRTPINAGFTFETTNHKAIPGGNMVDNCIDSNGVAWILVTTSSDAGLEVKLERSSGAAVTIEPNTFEESCYAMTNFKDGLVVVGDIGIYPETPTTEFGDFVFVNITDNKAAPSGNQQTKINIFGLPHVMKAIGGSFEAPESVETNRIAAMCSDGNDIFIVMENKVENQNTNTVESISNSVYKITLVADGLTGTATPVVDFGRTDIDMDSYYVTDAEVTDGNLYVTYIDMSCSVSSQNGYNHGTGDVSRGGLLKINIGTKSINKLPIISGEYCDNTNCGKFLVGPRKILAIKPKKLIIADDGAFVEDAAYGVSTKKRLISVDLENFIIESGSAVDIIGDVFEGSTAESACDSSTASFYYYKTNINAVRGNY